MGFLAIFEEHRWPLISLADLVLLGTFIHFTKFIHFIWIHSSIHPKYSSNFPIFIQQFRNHPINFIHPPGRSFWDNKCKPTGRSFWDGGSIKLGSILITFSTIWSIEFVILKPQIFVQYTLLTPKGPTSPNQASFVFNNLE